MSDIDDQIHLDPSQGLFSTVASDNVEVVGQASSRASAGLWTVAAKPYPESELQDETLPDWSTEDPSLQDSEEVWSEVSEDGSDDFSEFQDSENFDETTPRSFGDSMGSVFSADPVDHFDDSIDEAEIIGNNDWSPAVAPLHNNPLFSSGPERHSQASAVPGTPTVRGASTAPGTPTEFPLDSEDDIWEPNHAARPEWESFSAPAQAAASPSSQATAGAATGSEFEAAVLRLRPKDAEAANVALSVCGALLLEGERVMALLTGHMLGRPAAVLVTEYRVVIANDRRWQPVVDVFAINSQLTVRGRQDRDVAALSFSDRSRVSMVDGITEVAMAIELANLIRGTEKRAEGSSAAW